MAKKEPPQEYIEVLEVLNVLYDEVDGCSFYDYIFPDNQKQGPKYSAQTFASNGRRIKYTITAPVPYSVSSGPLTKPRLTSFFCRIDT